MWIILRDPQTQCTCVDPVTKQADPSCTKCLGTGRQIRIKQIEAAHQPLRYSLSGENLSSEYNLYSSYYTLEDIEANPEDIFVDNQRVDIVQDRYDEISNHTDCVYFRYLVAPKKTNTNVFLKNFYDIINGGDD